MSPVEARTNIGPSKLFACAVGIARGLEKEVSRGEEGIGGFMVFDGGHVFYSLVHH
jgi:hypothetical protein